jgi:drug/metabolite transporter (DMT)-like permease
MVASAGLVLGGALWGLFWLPARAFERIGLDGAWPVALIYLAATLLMLPLAWRQRQMIMDHWPALLVCGSLTGTAFTLYSTSLLLTEVVRAILLFYLTPVWATLLGLVFLGERLTLARSLALVLGLAGLLVVLSTANGLPWPRNLGDWMALASGIVWAYGSLQLYKLGAVALSEQVMAFIVGSLVAASAVLVLGGQAVNGAPSIATLTSVFPWALLTVFYVVPALVLTIWPATLLSPGRVGLLLMSEVVIGVASAAAWSGEPFGLRETLGSALIVSAGLVEVLGHRTRQTAV